MKDLYAHFRMWTVRLKNNKSLVYKTGYVNGRFYHYGTMSDDYVEEFTEQDTVFDDLRRTLGGYTPDKTLFKHREYLNTVHFDKRIYKDDLVSFEIQHKFKLIENNPRIKDLENDLGFNGYSELVFDREQELNSMMIKN